jgi:CheY-like chemotaxis protein
MARILIVDDDAIFGRLTQRRLEKAGHQAWVLDGPFGTIAELKKGAVDVLVLDVRMPALSGVDIVRMIRSRSALLRDMRIVLYSSLDEGALAELARTMAVDGHVSKSSGLYRLLDVIDAIVARRGASA